MSIVIVTSENDNSTDSVIDWLIFFHKEFYRINEVPSIHIDSIQISEKSSITIRNNDKIIFLQDVKAFWHRRHNFQIDFPKILIKKTFPFRSELQLNLKAEIEKTRQFIYFKLMQKKAIGNFFNVDINKLITLEKAQLNGISIPPTLITTKKKEAELFRQKYSSIVCKAISEAVLFSEINTGHIYNYTSALTDKTFDSLPETFALSLFQKKIDKKYELRIFYLHGLFYSMAIFSQNDPKTSVDFRNYNWKKPNRTIPFQLPENISTKLNALMKDLNLNTGSIDMAVTPNNEYIFFEVNPVGQFGMTSYPCNYNIEKKIAEFLSYEQN